MTKDKKIIIGLIAVLLIIIAIIIGLAIGSGSDSAEDDSELELENATSTNEDLGTEEAESGVVASDNVSSDITGVWRSQNISGYVLEISPDGVLREYQGRQLINTGFWSLSEASKTITLTVGGRSYPHSLITLSANRLELRGQSAEQNINFERIQ